MMKVINEFGFILATTLILISSESRVIEHTSVSNDTQITDSEVSTESSAKPEAPTDDGIDTIHSVLPEIPQNISDIKELIRIGKQITDEDNVTGRADIVKTLQKQGGEESKTDDDLATKTMSKGHETIGNVTSLFTDQSSNDSDQMFFVTSVLHAIGKALESGNFSMPDHQPSFSLEDLFSPEKKVDKRNAPQREKPIETENCTPCPQKGHFRFKQSCRKYLECKFSTKCNGLVSKIRTCPKCLKFNAEKKVCDLPDNVPECSYQNPEKMYCTGLGRFLVPGDCRKYYDCESTNGTITLNVRSCPSGTIYDNRERKCVPGGKCRGHAPKCAPGKFYLNDKFSCRKFYYCVTPDQSTALNCPPNNIFNNYMCEDWGKSSLNWENIPKK